MPDRSRARELASQYIERGDPTGWFEALYREGASGVSEIPWDDRKANAHLIQCMDIFAPKVTGLKAIVVGCGLGDDAEEVAYWDFGVTAFDISQTAIEMAKKRFPHTRVDFLAVDLFHAPSIWRQKFDFVFESNTLQALPENLRPNAIRAVADLVKPGGDLLAIARAREESDPKGDLPWPLTRAEIDLFKKSGLTEKSLRDINDPDPPHTRRFLAHYTRESA
jgi:2-polyprenyl-3-methyl-5-hydroxy-6-metoxy-1,4-benzoquinol methylase